MRNPGVVPALLRPLVGLAPVLDRAPVGVAHRLRLIHLERRAEQSARAGLALEEDETRLQFLEVRILLRHIVLACDLCRAKERRGLRQPLILGIPPVDGILRRRILRHRRKAGGVIALLEHVHELVGRHAPVVGLETACRVPALQFVSEGP